MNMLSKIAAWGDRHHPALFDIFRVLLGLFLLLKGTAFLAQQGYLEDAIAGMNVSWLSPPVIKAIMYYVIFVHMAGGLLIMIGIFTRLCSLLQLPIILAAILLINIFKSPVNSDLWLSIFCLAFLLLFTLIGSGPISLDKFLSKLNTE